MSILCKIFGHSISGAYYRESGYTRYFNASAGGVDGIGRQHIQLYAECDRCEEKFHVGNIHGDEFGNILSSADRERINALYKFENKLNDFLKRQKDPEPEVMAVLEKTYKKMFSDKPTKF